jgi:hypothetical protein
MQYRGWLIAAAIALACAPALAEDAEPAAKNAKSKPAKKAAMKTRAPGGLPAVDRRVADAKTIVVGEAVRIYFVDRRYQEVPYIRAAGEGPNRAAMILVKVAKVLHPANAEVSGRILVPIETNKGDIFSDRRSPYDEEVARYVGKQGIWFGDIVVRTDSGDDRIGRKPLEDPLTFLQAWDSKKRPVASAVPVAQLKEVEASINRVKKGGDAGEGPRDEGKIAQQDVGGDKQKSK